MDQSRRCTTAGRRTSSSAISTRRSSIIHGELDFRVPIGEGMQLYTAVQRKGIDSKLLIFPDEGHWVLKPQNSQLWYHTVIGWVDKYLK